jgi:hypothetical protein
MLIYNKDIYYNVLKGCVHNKINTFILNNESAIILYANNNNINISDIKKQIKLHIPQFDPSDIEEKQFFSSKIVPILNKRFNNYVANFQNYLQQCGFDTISYSDDLKLKNSYVVEKQTYKKVVEIEIREINEQDAKFIESELHYLRSFREDGIYRIGLFIKCFKLPICYMSFCKIDRDDKKEAIKKSLGSQSIDYYKMIELSRVFGCGKLPKDCISFLVSCGTKHFRKLGYEYMITAVNPYLDFNGISMIASNFSPFATRPVQYQYSITNGEYITIRSSGKKKTCKIKTPHNILYIKEIQKQKEKLQIQMVNINKKGSSITQIENDIHELRNSMENIWSETTRYHSTTFHHNDHKSKGQCGVSSMYLAKHLQEQGYDVRFCEGNVSFDGRNQIENHCWLKLLNYGSQKDTVIVDITADQNGYNQKVIFKTEQELAADNIIYDQKGDDQDVNRIGVQHLISRLEYLENFLENK